MVPKRQDVGLEERLCHCWYLYYRSVLHCWADPNGVYYVLQ